MKPKYTFDDVAGRKSLKNKLAQSVILPCLHPNEYEYVSGKESKGILLYGPPGCSKTYLAEALAGETAKRMKQDIDYMQVKTGDIMSRWYGGTLENLKKVFEDAKKNTPAFILFDELSSFFLKSSRNQQHYKIELTKTFLAEYLSIRDNKNIVVLGTTNQPWELNPEVLKKVFTNRFYLSSPDLETRVEVIKQLTKDIPISHHVKYNTLGKITKGYTASDIQCLIDKAGQITFEDRIENNNERPINMDDFFKAKDIISSSLTFWAKEVVKESEQLYGTSFEHLVDEAKLMLKEVNKDEKKR